MEKKIILTKTNDLKKVLVKINEIYEEVRQTKEDPDFFKTIKPFVDEVHQLTDEWNEFAKKWLQTNQAKNLFTQQIDAASENMKEICVQAFYPKTSYSRFKHSLNSIRYILEKLQREVEKK